MHHHRPGHCHQKEVRLEVLHIQRKALVRLCLEQEINHQLQQHTLKEDHHPSIHLDVCLMHSLAGEGLNHSHHQLGEEDHHKEKDPGRKTNGKDLVNHNHQAAITPKTITQMKGRRDILHWEETMGCVVPTPPPPLFYQALYTAGLVGGYGIQVVAPFSQGIPTIDIDNDTEELQQEATPQPQGEPEPELPGANEPPEPEYHDHPDEDEPPDKGDVND